MVLVIKGSETESEVIELERFKECIKLGINDSVIARFFDSGSFAIFCEEKQEWIKGRWKK